MNGGSVWRARIVGDSGARGAWSGHGAEVGADHDAGSTTRVSYWPSLYVRRRMGWPEKSPA